MEKTPNTALPDAALEKWQDRPQTGGLDWVGMERIETTVRFETPSLLGQRIPAKVAAFVDLAPASTRGIHMSRLYDLIQKTLPSLSLTPDVIGDLLRQMRESQQSLSSRSKIEIEFPLALTKHSLVTENAGIRTYPCSIRGELPPEGQPTLWLRLELLYSSTCPCSLALSRRHMADRFQQDFQENPNPTRADILTWIQQKGISATPHGQRSRAEVEVELLSNEKEFQISERIELLEAALSTPVQALVKREDELEFARLSAENPLFCEDAARRLEMCLRTMSGARRFQAKVIHMESLHAHDAVASISGACERV